MSLIFLETLIILHTSSDFHEGGEYFMNKNQSIQYNQQAYKIDIEH